MQLVHIYLNFPGTTKQAFQFYETVFGTKIAMIQTFGKNFHVSVVANDKAEADRVFAALSSGGGSVAMPLANAPWGPYFGMCVDRFGIHWMVSLPTPV